MRFSERLLAKSAAIWEREKIHPFVTGIGNGTLPLDKFRYYLKQDYIFLIDFCRVISMAVAKARNVDDMGWFARLLHETLNTEMGLHVRFCRNFGLTENDLNNTRYSPTTLSYTRHLTHTAFASDVEEIACSILPCMWGYSEIGKMLYDEGPPVDQPLYAQWIEMYSSLEFAKLADWLRMFIDCTAASKGNADLERMEEVFFISTRYEYRFWDASYRLEEWQD